MEYIYDCLSSGKANIRVSIIFFIFIFLKSKIDRTYGRDIGGYVMITFIFLVPGILDIHFYYEYSQNEAVVENVEIIGVENKILSPYSDFLSKHSFRKYRAGFLKASNGESYLIANTFWEKQFKDGVYLSKVIRIRYIDTMRYKIITSIENLQYPYY